MQTLVNGIITGLTVAVLALAFTATYLPTRIFFVALGGVYAIVPFIAWTCLKHGCPWVLVVAIAIDIQKKNFKSCNSRKHQIGKSLSIGIHKCQYLLWALS